MINLCHCGEPLHYTDMNVKEYVESVIYNLGEYINVKVGEKTYKVQRHYIALHGIKGYEIDKYGFEEIE